MPLEYWVWQLVFETGWTLEYVDALPVEYFYDWLSVREGTAKARGVNVAKNS